MNYLSVTGLTHGYGDKTLYHEAQFHLYPGEHMGVVGPNGAGKSTLLSILTGQTIPDEGYLERQKGLRLGFLDQYALVDTALTVTQYLKTAFSSLYDMAEEQTLCYERYSQTGDESLLLRAGTLQEFLDTADFYTIDTKIEQTAYGLGLDAIGLDRSLSTLSGGQRAKTILAKLLLESPDVLILDEPTNFLDQSHVDWLADFLSTYAHAFVVVSHDYHFLQRISTCICDVENGEIHKYHGTYEQFLTQKEHMREDYLRRYHTQQQLIAKEEAYIRRNIAGVNSSIAKGRRKRLGRLERLTAPTTTLIRPAVSFPLAKELPPQTVLEAVRLQIGYTYPLLPPLSFRIRPGQKVVITGFNGIGKSTLLNTVMGILPPLGGSYQINPQVKTAYFEQELHFSDPEQSPLFLLQEMFPTKTQKELRRQLGRYGLTQEHILQPVSTLSGGEQSRVKLCLLSFTPVNFLILDEPTNHLDEQSKEALSCALQAFEGTVLLVSHESSFYKKLDVQVFDIERGF